MRIQRLTATDFRNIRYAEFIPAEELTVICGENGQGKTNLLESVWLQTGGKSFRAAKDSQLVREGADFSVLESTVQDEQTQHHLRIAIGTERSEKKGRYAKVNGVDYGRATAIAGICTAVVFAPAHLSLVKGSPEGRRKFLDTALCQIQKSYIPLLKRYVRTLTQRNALLKNYRLTPDGAAILDVYDEQLANDGEQISRARQGYLEQIMPDALHNYSDIANGREQMKIAYLRCCEEGKTAALLRANRARDIAAGFTTEGAHREDFALWINERDAKAYASQGQQRSAVLSLKLAEAAAVKRVTGEHPVMLLDDVLSELDSGRQAYLLNRMQGKQTMVTTCDAHPFLQTSGKIISMHNGELKEL